MGAKFAKWRAVIDINERDVSAAFGIRENASVLARYTAICQELDIVCRSWNRKSLWMVPNGWCPMDGAQWMVPNGWCPMDGAQWMVPNGWCPMDGAQWMVPTTSNAAKLSRPGFSMQFSPSLMPAVNVTRLFAPKRTAQSVPHEIPAGEDEKIPAPSPDFSTVRWDSTRRRLRSPRARSRRSRSLCRPQVRKGLPRRYAQNCFEPLGVLNAPVGIDGQRIQVRAVMSFRDRIRAGGGCRRTERPDHRKTAGA